MGAAATGHNLGIHSFPPPPLFRDLAIIEARHIREKRAGGKGAIKFGNNNKKCLVVLGTQGACSLGKQQSSTLFRKNIFGKKYYIYTEEIFPFAMQCFLFLPQSFCPNLDSSFSKKHIPADYSSSRIVSSHESLFKDPFLPLFFGQFNTLLCSCTPLRFPCVRSSWK